jgi:hypothetical protein
MEFIKSYFTAEKAASFLFMGVGVTAVLFSLYCWLTLKKSFYMGMAYPLVLIGLIEIAVGVTIYWRSPKDIERVENFLTLEPERVLREEIPRMEAVMRSFVTFRYVELLSISIGILAMFYISNSDLVKGIGVGLFMQASVMLAADYFAERRGEQYLEQLRQEVSTLNKQS